MSTSTQNEQRFCSRGGSCAGNGFEHAAYRRKLSAYKKVNGSIQLVDANITTAPLITSPKCDDLEYTKNLTTPGGIGSASVAPATTRSTAASSSLIDAVIARAC